VGAGDDAPSCGEGDASSFSFNIKANILKVTNDYSIRHTTRSLRIRDEKDN
jgi:hypothetical protein